MDFSKLFLVIPLTILSTSIAAQTQETVPYKVAVNSGITTCLAQIKELTEYVLKNDAHASHDIWNSVDSDRRMFSSFIVKSYSDMDTHINLVIGPDKTGKCYGEYNETAIWPKACAVLREEMFADFEFYGSLTSTSFGLQNASGDLNVYLTPQTGGNSCLTTRREIIYF